MTTPSTVTYPVIATVHIPSAAMLPREYELSKEAQFAGVAPGRHTIRRVGGGGVVFGAEVGGETFFPTKLWAVSTRAGHNRFFLPEDTLGLTIVSVDAYHEGEDPLHVADGWPIGLPTASPYDKGSAYIDGLGTSELRAILRTAMSRMADFGVHAKTGVWSDGKPMSLAERRMAHTIAANFFSIFDNVELEALDE